MTALEDVHKNNETRFCKHTQTYLATHCAEVSTHCFATMVPPQPHFTIFESWDVMLRWTIHGQLSFLASSAPMMELLTSFPSRPEKHKQNAGCKFEASKKIKSHQSKSCLLFCSEWMINIRASVYRGCTLKSGLWSWEIKVQHFSLSPSLLCSSTNTVSRSLQKAMAVMKNSVAVPLCGEGGRSAALYALLERWLSLVPPFTSQTTPKKMYMRF